MKNKIIIPSLALIFLVPSFTFAQIYKCTSKGKTTFQSDPCPIIKEKNTQPSGFGFDGWQFGMDIRSVKLHARDRQLAMSPGRSAFFQSYNERLINSQPKQRVYTYKTKIMDKLTSVHLFFTKTTQELYKIDTSFYVLQLKPEERKYFYESLYTRLTEKYGHAEQIKKESTGDLLADFILKDTSIINQSIIWKPAKSQMISLGYKKRYPYETSYKLSYESLPLALQNKKEITYDLKQRTNKAMIRDGSKL